MDTNSIENLCCSIECCVLSCETKAIYNHHGFNVMVISRLIAVDSELALKALQS
jgi:membrane carboxypeptidase/penicillin-binding protein